MPTRPDLETKSRGSWLSIVLAGLLTLAILAVLTLLTLGYFGPIILLGLGIFLIIGLQYLVWGWWFERIYRSSANEKNSQDQSASDRTSASESRDPTDAHI